MNIKITRAFKDPQKPVRTSHDQQRYKLIPAETTKQQERIAKIRED